MTESDGFDELKKLLSNVSYDVQIMKHIVQRITGAVVDREAVKGFLSEALDELDEAMLQADEATRTAASERIQLMREFYGCPKEPSAQSKKRSHLRLVVSREDPE